MRSIAQVSIAVFIATTDNISLNFVTFWDLSISWKAAHLQKGQ